MTFDLLASPLTRDRLSDIAAALREAALPTDDLRESEAALFAFRLGGEVVGYGGFELHSDDALLRSIVVLPDRRRQGVGRRIVELLLAIAARTGAQRGYLLRTDARDYFEGLGFAIVDRHDAPAPILATRQAACLCPVSAALMVKAAQ